MDAHFNKILGSQSGGEDFIASETFAGRRKGYVFRNGNKGVGYYIDASQKVALEPELHMQKKRKLVNDSYSEKTEGNEEDNDDGDNDSKSRNIEKLLADADSEEILQLDANSLKQLLLSFERKITKNQKMRMKYSDSPEKFMESEIELHNEIQELFSIAASPELYPILVQTSAVNSILGMITHENTDISITTISLLSEMTDVDSVLEEQDAAMEFINAFVAAQGLELVVQNLARLDETNEEDAQGVHNSMSILENLIELNPELSVTLCEKTHILKFLLVRLKNKTFDANKLYCSEILSIILQSDTRNQLRLTRLVGIDGMDSLLQCIAMYRKKVVDALDEQECVENLFLCLSSALMPRENQMKFLASEGFELLVRCLKEQEYAAGCAVGALSYAVMKNQACCERLIDVGGLKYIFPLLVGRGFKKSLKKKASGEKRNVEEVAISVIAQLCSLLGTSTKNDYSSRLLNKFLENEREKLERCVELYAVYLRQLIHTENGLEETRSALLDSGDTDALEDFDDEENILSLRLEGGLFNMQQLSVAIAFACVFDRDCFKKAEIKLSSCTVGAGEDSLSMDDVLDTLRDHAAIVAEGIEETVDENENGEVKEDREIAIRYKQLLTEWCAALSNIIETSR